MDGVNIKLRDGLERYLAGDTIEGNAEVVLPENVPISTNVSISFHCVGEVKWTEYPSTPYYMDGYVYFEEVKYHEDVLLFTETDVSLLGQKEGNKKVSIPFSFVIPKDKNLPSTMVSAQGQIQYFVRVTVREEDEVKTFVKDVVVQAPMEKNLMITVGGSMEKFALLHGGKVSVHASIGRKGFAPGEKITVHLNVDNKSNTKVVPRVSLHQLQIFMSGERHKTIESIITEEPIVGEEIGAHKEEETLLVVKIPSDEALSIKSSVITVKYFLHITVDIPHAFDLHINLPIVVTAKRVLEELRQQHNLPELVGSKSEIPHVFK